jgi:hypothetical protein
MTINLEILCNLRAALEVRRASALGLSRSATDAAQRVAELRSDMAQAARAAKVESANRGATAADWPDRPDRPQYQAARQAVAEAEGLLTILRQHAEAASATVGPLAELVAACDAYATGDARLEAPHLASLRDLWPTVEATEDLSATRAHLERIAAQRRALLALPLNRDEAMTSIGRQIDALADGGRDRVDRCVSAVARGRSDALADMFEPPNNLPGNSRPMLEAISALIGPDLLKAGFARALEQVEDGPSRAQIADEVADLDRQALALGIAEERHLRAVSGAIDRRPDANPAVVLYLEA